MELYNWYIWNNMICGDVKTKNGYITFIQNPFKSYDKETNKVNDKFILKNQDKFFIGKKNNNLFIY